MTIVDGDVVDITNIKQTITGLAPTVDSQKITVVGDRLMDINPD
jgi:tRNA A37 threonylcarbamoyladenosine dehydratase